MITSLAKRGSVSQQHLSMASATNQTGGASRAVHFPNSLRLENRETQDFSVGAIRNPN